MSQSCCVRWPRHVLVHPPIRAFTGSDSRTGPAHSPPCPKARTPAPGHEHRQSAQPGCPGAGRRSGAGLERGCREAMAPKSRLEEASPGCAPSPGKGNPGLWALGWSGPEALSRQPAPSGGRGSCGEQGSGGRSPEVAKVSVGRGTGCSREGDRAPPRTEPKGRRAAWHFPDPQGSPPPSPPQPPVRTRSALSAARVTLSRHRCVSHRRENEAQEVGHRAPSHTTRTGRVRLGTQRLGCGAALVRWGSGSGTPARLGFRRRGSRPE